MRIRKFKLVVTIIKHKQEWLVAEIDTTISRKYNHNATIWYDDKRFKNKNDAVARCDQLKREGFLSNEGKKIQQLDKDSESFMEMCRWWAKRNRADHFEEDK